MAISKTKYQATDEEIRALFARHGITGITQIAPLGDGEFNAAFRVETPDKVYVLKVAPQESAPVLHYEQGMMHSEVYWYEQIHAHTDLAVPEVIASDFTHRDLGSGCFIMEYLDAQPLYKFSFTDEEYRAVQERKIAMLTEIHRVQGERFGYPQLGLQDTWYAAIRGMAEALVQDCEAMGRKTPDGRKFLTLIDRHREILEKVPCRMVNFDLWDSNVLYADGKLYWIDPVRSFYGDPIADFITLGKGQKTPLDEKTEEIAIYNRTASEQIRAGREECIRYAVAVAYLALIEEVERYVRYEPDNPVYQRNERDARDMYDMAFAVLEADGSGQGPRREKLCPKQKS